MPLERLNALDVPIDRRTSREAEPLDVPIDRRTSREAVPLERLGRTYRQAYL